MASVPRTLERIKEDLRPFLSEESILAAAHEAGHTWRERLLGPVHTVHHFIFQILFCNTAMTHLRHVGNPAVKAPAYCRARKAGDLLLGDRGFCPLRTWRCCFPAGFTGFSASTRSRSWTSARTASTAASIPRNPSARNQREPKKGRCRAASSCGGWASTTRWCGGSEDTVIRPKWMSDEQYDALPDSLLVRELRLVLPRKGQRTLCITIATTLLDPLLYPKQKIAELYGVRWQVETHFAELKTTLKMRKLKSKTAEGVKKELAVYALVYNLVHVVMVRAARRQDVAPQRISFIDTVRWLLGAEPGEELPDLVFNPHRPDRHEPRVVKDREDTYTKMTHPRSELRKALKKQAKSH
jgi:hypothetical protein